MLRVVSGRVAALALLGLTGCAVPPYAIGDDAASGGAAIDPADANDATIVDVGPVSDTATAPKCASDLECPSGRWCRSDGVCAPGCRDDGECAVPGGGATGVRCDLEKHVCRGCAIDDECPLGTVCAAGGVCAPGCTATHPCAEGGGACCGGKCVDTTTDVLHCGGCDKACAPPAHGTATCAASACAIASCDPGFADCDKKVDNGCESELAKDAQNCGACGKACKFANAGAACVESVCEMTICNVGFDDCDSKPTNGCEKSLATLTDCGECGNACAPPNATGTCASRACAIASCATGFADCDGSAETGCEVDVRKDANNCGACGTKCPSTNGTPACNSGACKYSKCKAGLGDCDGTGRCETNLASDVANCGACGNACSAPHATPKCTSGTCGIAACDPGWKDCDGVAANGCETNAAAGDAGACPG